MQRNMIMLISCQGLCAWASYVNYTTGCICTASVLQRSAPVDGFAEIHLMALRHLEELALLTASRAEKVTVFMGNYYVEKKNMSGSISNFPRCVSFGNFQQPTVVVLVNSRCKLVCKKVRNWLQKYLSILILWLHEKRQNQFHSGYTCISLCLLFLIYKPASPLKCVTLKLARSTTSKVKTNVNHL